MDFFSGFGLLYVITIWFTIIIVFLENREPSKTALWIIVLAFLPGIGFLLYLLFGENVRSKQYIRAQKVAENFKRRRIAGHEEQPCYLVQRRSRKVSSFAGRY